MTNLVDGDFFGDGDMGGMLQLTVLNGGVLSEKFNQDCQTFPPKTMAIHSKTVPKNTCSSFFAS